MKLNYDVVFINRDGEIERIGYVHEDDARFYFGLFNETDADIYSEIYVENLETEEIILKLDLKEGARKERGRSGSMKLIELLEIITDESKVVVEDTEGEVYEIYDGKNSIDPKYNEREIINVSSGFYQINITIR